MKLFNCLKVPSSTLFDQFLYFLQLRDKYSLDSTDKSYELENIFSSNLYLILDCTKDKDNPILYRSYPGNNTSHSWVTYTTKVTPTTSVVNVTSASSTQPKITLTTASHTITNSGIQGWTVGFNSLTDRDPVFTTTSTSTSTTNPLNVKISIKDVITKDYELADQIRAVFTINPLDKNNYLLTIGARSYPDHFLALNKAIQLNTKNCKWVVFLDKNTDSKYIKLYKSFGFIEVGNDADGGGFTLVRSMWSEKNPNPYLLSDLN